MAVINQFAIIFWKNWKIFKNNRLSIILNLCVIVVVISVVTILGLYYCLFYFLIKDNELTLFIQFIYKNV